MSAVNLRQWIQENRAALQPPVCNKLLYGAGQLKVMIVGGPNVRDDFHLEEGEEFFYQLEGDMVLKTIVGGQPRDVPIRQGDMFVLPGHVPHSPQRFANSIGLVIERERAAEEIDGLMWFASGTSRPLYREFFHCEDLGVQLKPVIERYRNSEAHKTGQTMIDLDAALPVSIDHDVRLDAPIHFPSLLQDAAGKQPLRPLFHKGEFKIDLVAPPAVDGAQPLQLPGATADTEEVFVYVLSGQVEIVITQNGAQTTPLRLSTDDVFLLSTQQHRPFRTTHAPGSVCLLVRIVPRGGQQQASSPS